jgi:tetratricopeptide (TPR) repeat protein
MIFIFLVVVPNPLQRRILTDYQVDPYSLSRIEMWKEAVVIIRDHPLGIGFEMYPLISPQYAFPIKGTIQQYNKIAESPHNEYLRLFAETGIAGGIFFISAIALFYLKWIDSKNKSFLHDGMLAGTVIFFVHALVDSNFHEPALVITVITLSTLVLDKRLFYSSSHASPVTPHPSRFTVYLLLITFCLLLAFLIIKPAIGWFYYDKGYEQMKQHQYQQAVGNIQTALLLENQNARYHNALANVYFNLFVETHDNDWVIQSLDELDSALELNPIDGNYYKIKGKVYKTLAMRVEKKEHLDKLYGEAFTNYQNALKLLPYDASIYLELAEIHTYFRRYGDAETAYNRSITLEPNYLLAREKKIELLLKTGKKEEADKEYQKLIFVYDNLKNRVLADSEKKFIDFNQKKLEELLKS